MPLPLITRRPVPPPLEHVTAATLVRWHVDASGLTIRAWAAEILKSERTVSRWIDGEHQPSRTVLIRLLDEYQRHYPPQPR